MTLVEEFLPETSADLIVEEESTEPSTTSADHVTVMSGTTEEHDINSLIPVK